MTGPLFRRTVLSGQKAEKRTAARMEARQTPGSGAIEGAKGDMRLTNLLIENKSTVHSSFSVQLLHLDKITKEALNAGRVPALSFQFVDMEGNPRKNAAWVAIPEWFFKELVK